MSKKTIPINRPSTPEQAKRGLDHSAASRAVPRETGDAIADALRRGFVTSAICGMFGCGNSTVQRVRNEYKIEPSGPRIPPATAYRNREVALYARLEIIRTLPLAERRGAQLRLAQEIREGKVA